jgi:hypothetical protein
MSYDIVYASNGVKLGDGVRIVRISGNGTKLEVMTNTTTERFSEVILKNKTSVVSEVTVVGEPKVGSTVTGQTK